MRKSGTKPIKNTMRKQSPLKFAELSTPEGKAASYGASRPKGAVTRNTSAKDVATTKASKGKSKLTKDNTVKIGGMIRVSKEKAAEVAAKKAAKTETSTKTTKESPLKFFTHNVALTAARKVSDAVSAKADKVKAQKAAKTETSTKTTTPKPNPAGKPASKTETSVKAPTMQLKEASMKKAAMKKKY